MVRTRGGPGNPSPLPGAAACKAAVKTETKPLATLASAAASGIAGTGGGVPPPAMEAHRGRTGGHGQVSSRKKGMG